ncbi:hypothetical protein KY349_03760 [Candidatus Woesearchaeota archaeon]|jgi:hypothetical protein|nr:hypothetical protein [Candidatus Woesearchaeota archaeon]
MIKTSVKEGLEAILRPLKDDIQFYSPGMDLFADIMFSLNVNRFKKGQNGSKEGLTHSLSFKHINNRKYTDIKGREFDIVKGCGIAVPREQKIAEIGFLSPEDLESRQYDAGQLVMRTDERWGPIYADINVVYAAYIQAMETIKQWESKEIDLKKAVPHADMELKMTADVSVAGLGMYFCRFSHCLKDGTKAHDNYNSAHDQEFSQLSFTTEDYLIPYVDRNLLC